ncbi:MAG: hypothetical protein L6Q57_02670 [Alphaproteobacteria bacterium]|nr:hypothetical protein [Alphaproteobacteria bacterium]
MSIKDVIRDTAFIFFLTYWSGFVMGYAGLMNNPYIFLTVSYAVVFSGFCLIISWTPSNALQRILSVAALLWLLTASEHFPRGYYKEWMISGVAVFAMALLSLYGASCLKKILKP